MAYGYTLADRLDTVTYPSGVLVTYQRNAAGQITGITAKLTPTGSPVTVVADVAYLPFGPLTALSFGNGRVLTKAFDQNYGIDAISDNVSGGFELGFSLDDVGNVAGLGERLASGTIASRTVIHDGLDRLSEMKDGATLVQGFGYDATGNRLSKTAGSTTNYTIEATSHRLTAVGSQARVYDDAGNSTSIGSQHFSYDDRGRLREVRNGTTHVMSYELNGKGERVAKLDQITQANSVYFVYDEAGHLLGEYEANGDAIKEYVWLDDTLVAVIGDYAGQPIQYLMTDHLGTTRVAVNPASNAIIWRWDLTETAFGEHAAQIDPDGDSVEYALNVRHPGQYFDDESGLHYNYYRDYDPSTSRYAQSDPIGFGGGPSTFAYTVSNPTRFVDPSGLKVGDCYRTPEIAAANALAEFYKISVDMDHEYGGRIYKRPNGTYSYTARTDKLAHGVWPGPLPNNLAGTWHTHGAYSEGYNGETFSRPDMRNADDLAILAMRKYGVGSSRVDLQACKLEYSIVSPK